MYVSLQTVPDWVCGALFLLVVIAVLVRSS